MKDQLTNQEKKKKRAEARRRAILWSEREIRKRQLKTTQAKVETITISDNTESEPSNISKSSATILSEFFNITQQQCNENIVVSLQKTIQDLQIQKQELDHGIEKESISFIPTEENRKPSYIEVKYTISGSGFKTQLPIFKGGSAEDLLRFLNEFQGARSKLGYSNYQKLESGIEQLLQGTAKDEWNTIKGTVQPGTNTLQTFERRIEAFRQIYIPEPAAVDNQKSYLLRVRKNDRLTVP